MILISCNTGCIFNEDWGYTQTYYATYNQILNSSAVFKEFRSNNITYYSNPYMKDLEDEYLDSYLFLFGKGINNDSIESSCGQIDFYSDIVSTHLAIWLNESEYPLVKNKDNLKQREPLLTKSMNYILETIYNATDQWPNSKGITVDDTD